MAVRSFTFDQPRTGDTAYADFLEATVGPENIFRASLSNSHFRSIRLMSTPPSPGRWRPHYDLKIHRISPSVKLRSERIDGSSL
ncbi:hypothetical protein BGW80DRAFT_1314813 [Lactifluus volemus]|nr:hypothetical protein BGW80DRAFT_1314813 [Lactifluus volemus]